MTKKELRVLNMIYTIFLLVFTVFGRFFHGSGFSGSEPDFLPRSGSGLGKKV